MTALEERPAAASPCDVPEAAGVRRAAREVRRGWHVQLDGVWRLVESADATAPSPHHVHGVVLTVRTGMHDTETVVMPRDQRLPTRTVPEQIRYVEACRVAQMPGRGLGPVGRVHFDQEVLKAIAQGVQKGAIS